MALALEALPTNRDLSAPNLRLSQCADHFIGRSLWHVDQAESARDLNGANVSTTETRLASDGTNEVLGAQASFAAEAHVEADRACRSLPTWTTTLGWTIITATVSIPVAIALSTRTLGCR